MTKLHFAFVLTMLCALLNGCAGVAFVAPEYSPNYELIDKTKKLNLNKLSVGYVQPTDPGSKVNHIRLRAARLASPSGTFAKYLENALISDFTEMGFYDATSGTRIDATILRNDIVIFGPSKGTGLMEVKLKVMRAGKVIFEKSYTAKTEFDTAKNEFESAFDVGVADLIGQNEYPNLVRALLSNVYSDQDFIKVLQK